MTQTESAILAHARRCAPAESCGFVVRTPEGERYIPCVNISAEPEAYFRIAPEDWLRAEMQGDLCRAGGVFSYCTGRLAAGRDAGG
ncbi:Mov34/MPN/PAD-1 family protein, partial [Escherichia coli]|uniref:Mov34/MPN/PAD-1 family protein n=1 Tax=Escherichia coli TaxID=562 RepID=UPI002023CF9F